MSAISVVIPAYNQPQMLGEALASVAAQTLAPVEVIVIDDCSPEPLEPRVAVSPELPLRFIRQERNLGPAGTVAHGIRMAQGELITILNHDDAWEPAFLERLAGALAAHPEAGFAFCDHGIMLADGERDERLSRAQSERFGRTRLHDGVLAGVPLYEAALLHKAVAASSFALSRRRALDIELIETGADMWDYFLGVGACRASASAVYVADRLGWYRFSPTMLTTTWVDPRKQIEMARPQTAIMLYMLRSAQFAPVRRAVAGRLALAVRHGLAAGVRSKSPAGFARALARINGGVRDASRLLGREDAGASMDRQRAPSN